MFSFQQEYSRSGDSDPDSIDSAQRDAFLFSPRSNHNVTGNLLSESVVVNIEDNSEDTITSNESNSDADVDREDDEGDEMDAIMDEGDGILHHNDWEVRMLAAELKKRKSVTESQTLPQTSENDGLLRRRRRRSDADTDASENEASHSRSRAASLDQHNLRKQKFKSPGVCKAMNFNHDDLEL